MDDVVSRLSAAFTMHWLEGADHSFHVLKSSGTNDAAVMDRIATTSAEWLARLPKA